MRSLELHKEKHIWFGAIGFENETLEHPEVVVVVFSRFGSGGYQVAPIAARMIDKWREIQEGFEIGEE